MLFLRSTLYFLGSVIVLVAVCVVGLVFSFANLQLRYKIISKWAIFCVWWLGITCRIQLNLIGKENIPAQPCVIISNHQSTWETLGFQTIFPHQTWVLKQELLWIPLFGWGLALLQPVIINRSDKKNAIKTVITQGIATLKKGVFMIIFPEGTRQPNGQLGSYQKGGVAIAKAAKCNLLPVYHNAGKVWAKGNFIKYPGVITVVIGTPICASEKTVSLLNQEIKNWTQQQADIYSAV